jgi:hypothetical protein
MPDLGVLRMFVLRFAVIYGVLVLPWEPLRQYTTRLFQVETRWVLGLTFGQKRVHVEPWKHPEHPSIDSRVTIEEARQTQAAGERPLKVIMLDGRSLGWIPHAFWLALCGATPGDYFKRLRMLFAGLVPLQLLVAAGVLSATLPAFLDESSKRWQAYLVEGLNHLLVENLWFSFVVPLLVWSLLLARQGHWQAFMRREENSRESDLPSKH